MTTIPEAPETLKAQLDWLLAGKRRAVLIPSGTPMPSLPAGAVEAFVSSLGLFLYRPHRGLTAAEIVTHIHNDTVGDLLGYGVPRKPEGRGRGDQSVVIRGPNGVEKQTVVLGANSEPETSTLRSSATEDGRNAEQAAQALADPGDTVTVEPTLNVVAERLAALARDQVTLHRPVPGDAEALAALAQKHPEARQPRDPVWTVRRGQEVIGCVAVPTIGHLWLPVELQLRQTSNLIELIESHFRLAGVTILGALIELDCNFYPYKERFGWLEMENERVCFKVL